MQGTRDMRRGSGQEEGGLRLDTQEEEDGKAPGEEGARGGGGGGFPCIAACMYTAVMHPVMSSRGWGGGGRGGRRGVRVGADCRGGGEPTCDEGGSL